MNPQFNDQNMNESAEYLDTVRLGAIRALGRFRRLLKPVDGEAYVVLTRQDSRAVSDMLAFTEEHLLAMWELTQLKVEHKALTKLNTQKIE